MYSVFLVDDEPIVLDGIRSKIDWENSGFTFAGEASDGEIALSMLSEIKPDILITDIKMPFMDGLELATAIKKIQPWIKIIILSGHDEFDYAKKAISIGIEDYLLKPFTLDEVLKTLNKVKEHIDKERNQISNINKMKEELKSRDKLLQNEFLTNLVKGNIAPEEIRIKCQELKINLISRYYKILISNICSKVQNEQNLEQAISRLNSYSSSWEQAVCFFNTSNQLITIQKGNSQTELEENVFRIAETIEHIVLQNSDCTVITVIGKTVEHTSSIESSFSNAKTILDSLSLQNQNRIISVDDFNTENNELLEFKENDPLVDRLKYASKNDISVIVNESMELINNNKSQFSVFASYLLLDLIFEVSKLIESLGGNIKEIKPEILQHSFVEKSVENQENFKTVLEEVLNFALEYRDSKITGKYGDVILKAKKYIDEHYKDPNTTLTTVAQEVCLSPNHFSTIFSQECKTTFIEYLTNVRIENAKKLIKSTELKGYDIAYECGFSDPHYFSYIFKKITGLSPREYKK